MDTAQQYYLQEYIPALVENTGLEVVYQMSAFLGYTEIKKTPRVEFVQFIVFPIIGGFAIVAFTLWLASLWIQINYNSYIMLVAMEYWGWIDSNFIDDIVGWFFNSIEANYIFLILIWPIQEFLSVYLSFNDDQKFSPLDEWQAYFFTQLVYPYIYFISLTINLTQINTIPIMLFWYLVDSKIFVKQLKDGTNIISDNYTMIYAQSFAINAILYGDLSYLYIGKRSFQINFVNFVGHWVTSVLQLILSPVFFPFMLIWGYLAGFEIICVYIYYLLLPPPDQKHQDAVDDYYESDEYYGEIEDVQAF